jgi:hypothetical protein
MSGRRAVGGFTKRACVDLLQKAGFGAKPEHGSPAASTSSTHAQTFLPATPVLLRGTTFSVYSSEWSWSTRTQRSWTARHLGLRPKGACDMYDEERCRDHAREKMSEGRITVDRSSPASPPPTSLRISRSQPLDPLLCQYGRLSADRPGVMAEHYEQENEQQNKTWQDMSREWRYVVCGVVGANCVVFLMWQATSIRRFMAKNFAISSAGVLKEGRLHTLITSIFSHYDAVHLGANMACLVIFGKSLMPILGRSRFLALYLGAGIASSLAQVAWPVVAPDHLRYSPYQLGLGARCVCVCVCVCVRACVCACVCVCVRVAAFGNSPYQPGLGRQVEAWISSRIRLLSTPPPPYTPTHTPTHTHPPLKGVYIHPSTCRLFVPMKT